MHARPRHTGPALRRTGPVAGKGSPLAETAPSPGTQSPLSRMLARAWASLRIPPVPDYSVDEPTDGRESWLRQLGRIRYALENARTALVRDGWTGGAWFTVEQSPGSFRRATAHEAFGLVGPQASVANACLVGTLLRMADDPDQVPTIADVWGCVDELYEAMHEQLGHHSFPPGRAYPSAERRARLQGLTAWNDTPGRTREQVLDVVDRAVARTIVAACR